MTAAGCAGTLPSRGSPPSVGDRPARQCADPCPWHPVRLPRLGVTSQITGMVAARQGDVWVAAQAGKGWSNPQDGPDASWMEPSEHNLMLHLQVGRWTHVPIPPTTGPITQLTAAGPADIWAIADGGSLLRWNGTRWRVVPTPNLRDVALSGLAVLGRHDAWAVGSDFQRNGSTALIEHWNGHAWRRESSAQGHAPNPADGDRGRVAKGACGAFGGYVSDNPTGIHMRSGIVTEHWDGTRWRLVPQPVFHHTKHAFTIHAAAMQSSTQGWAVGDDRGTHTIALHWDGTQWRPAGTPGCCELLATAATADSGGWAAGDAIDRHGHGYRPAELSGGSAAASSPSPRRTSARQPSTRSPRCPTDASTSPEPAPTAATRATRSSNSHADAHGLPVVTHDVPSVRPRRAEGGNSPIPPTGFEPVLPP